MTRIAIALAIFIGATFLAWTAGHSQGAASVQSKWDQAEAQRARQVAIHAAQETRRQATITERYSAAQAEQSAVLAKLRAELRQALRRPLQCPAPGDPDEPPSLADVPIPAAAVERLRRAGSDPGSP